MSAIHPCLIRNLHVLAYAAGFTHWVYIHKGPLAEALAPGYFNAASAMLTNGDAITITASDGFALVQVYGQPPALRVRGAERAPARETLCGAMLCWAIFLAGLVGLVAIP